MLLKISLSWLACGWASLCLATPAKWIEQLGSDDYSERYDALSALKSAVAEATVEGVNHDSVEALGQRLMNGAKDNALPPQQRADLIRLVGLLGNDALVADLAELARNRRMDALLRENAVQALGQMETTTAAHALIEGLETADAATRAWWITALAYRADPATGPGLVGLLQRGRLEVDETVLLALGKIGGESVATYLFKAWEGASATARPAFARALLDSGDASASQLREIMAGSEATSLQVGAFSELLRTAPDAAQQILREALRGEARAVRGLMIAAALGSGEADYWSLIMERIATLSEAETLIVIRALQEAQAGRYEANLLGMLSDARPAVALAAVTALGDVGGSRSREPLIALLDSVDEEIQRAAQTSLARLRDPRLDAEILRLASDLQNPTQAQAIELIALRNPAGGLERLHQLLFEPLSDDTRRTVLNALEIVGDVSTCKLLLGKILTEADESVKRRLQISLKRLTVRQAIPDTLWAVAYQPALDMAVLPRQAISVIEILDGLSNASALNYITDRLSSEADAQVRRSLNGVLGRWTDLEVCTYYFSIIDSPNATPAEIDAAVQGARRSLSFAGVDGTGPARARYLGELFLQTGHPEVRQAILQAVAQEENWKRYQFMDVIRPYLELSAYEEDLERLLEE